MDSTRSTGNRPFAALRKLIRERAPAERCEMCSADLAAGHQHLIEPSSRRLICACDACAVLFDSQVETRYRRVPRRIRFLPGFRMTDAQWDSLMIPISIAFFFNSSAARRIVALYPSPAGATESLLSLDSWDEIVQANPILKEMEPDVEALLVNRVSLARGGPDAQYYIAPIDECYRLVGLIRANWRGLSGGTRAWKEIASFFDELKQRSRPVGDSSHARPEL